MSDKRKLGPIRQLSLQTDSRNRPILKKQLSIEQLDSVDEHKPRGRIVESAKNKLSDRPRPVRVAWAETRQSSRDEPKRFPDSVEVKKCKEHKRPTTGKLRTQATIEKDSLLYTRQELAERLRKAWKDREENKQNLDIFLTHNVHDNEFDDNDHSFEYESTIEKKKSEDKTSDDLLNNNNSIKTQKPTVRKNSLVNPEYSYQPSQQKPKDIRTNISVTIPSVSQNYKSTPQNSQSESLECPNPPELDSIQSEEKKESKLLKQHSLLDKENENIVKNLPPRPQTAASKRESFQKRTNTAFNGSFSGKEFRAPFTRTLSVPIKSDKPKFISSKRRIKPARRKDKDEQSGDEDEDGEKTNKKGSRCKSAPSGELVTMVSLVSPAGSDTEEVPENKKTESKSRSASPVKAVHSNPVNTEPPKTITLRKTVKSVSFQQSSIHTVRSFSASFPSRRSAMAAVLTSQTTPEREKRAPVESSPGENRGPKRRLLRTTSNSQSQSKNSFDEENTSESSTDPSNESLGVTKAELLPGTDTSSESNEPEAKSNEKECNKSDEKKDEEDAVLKDPSTPKLETTKEKECWIMYKKMSDKGLPVSFDTILRGMLTPTEYRSARKEIAS